MADILTPPPDNSRQPRRTYQFDSAGWRRTALRSDVLTDAAKVLAAVLADSVKVDGTVSVPRDTLADHCGCSERQISERLKQLVEVRFLDRVSAGKRGHTAIYRALRPTDSARQDRSHSEESARFHLTHSTTAQPRAFSESVEREEPGKRAAEPRTSSKSVAQTPPLHSIDRAQFTSALLSLEEKEVHEVDARGGEPQPLAVVLEGLFARGAA